MAFTQQRITSYAKRAAFLGLQQRAQLPKSKQFGLSIADAQRLGVDSGVRRARQLIHNDYLPYVDVVRTARFYARFKNCYTPKCEGAMLLWGGRRWCRQIYFKVYGK